MRQGIVKHRMLGIQPFAIQHIAIAQYRMQGGFMGFRPQFQIIELALAPARLFKVQIMAARLHMQPTLLKTDADIGAV